MRLIALLLFSQAAIAEMPPREVLGKKVGGMRNEESGVRSQAHVNKWIADAIHTIDSYRDAGKPF